MVDNIIELGVDILVTIGIYINIINKKNDDNKNIIYIKTKYIWII